MDIKEAADFVKKEAEKAGIKDLDDVKDLAKKAGIEIQCCVAIRCSTHSLNRLGTVEYCLCKSCLTCA